MSLFDKGDKSLLHITFVAYRYRVLKILKSKVINFMRIFLWVRSPLHSPSLFKLLELGPVELESVAHRLPVGPNVLGEDEQVAFTQHPVRVPQRPSIQPAHPADSMIDKKTGNNFLTIQHRIVYR